MVGPKHGLGVCLESRPNIALTHSATFCTWTFKGLEGETLKDLNGWTLADVKVPGVSFTDIRGLALTALRDGP